MKYTLTNDEIRRALAAVIGERSSTDVDPEECWFYVENSAGEVNDIESVEFSTQIESDI